MCFLTPLTARLRWRAWYQSLLSVSWLLSHRLTLSSHPQRTWFALTRGAALLWDPHAFKSLRPALPPVVKSASKSQTSKIQTLEQEAPPPAMQSLAKGWTWAGLSALKMRQTQTCWIFIRDSPKRYYIHGNSKRWGAGPLPWLTTNRTLKLKWPTELPCIKPKWPSPVDYYTWANWVKMGLLDRWPFCTWQLSTD